jgi:hypothetical protein
MIVLEPAPDGFEFDHEELKRESVAALKDAAPELGAILEDLHWFCELGDDRIPTVTVTHSSGALVGTLKLDWRRVGFLVGENGS